MNLIIFSLYRDKLLYDLVSEFNLEFEIQTQSSELNSIISSLYQPEMRGEVLLNRFSISLPQRVDYPQEVLGQNRNIYFSQQKYFKDRLDKSPRTVSSPPQPPDHRGHTELHEPQTPRCPEDHDKE